MQRTQIRSHVGRALPSLSTLSFAAALVGWALPTLPAHGQQPIGTAFTYQGRIKQAGNLVTGSCDFRFKLFDAAAGGNQIGPELVFDGTAGNGSPIAASNGLFRADLDFGAGSFNGDKRWLDITVRCPHVAGGGTTGYIPVSPRQEITPTPYALQTHRANALDAADGSPTNALFVDNNGNVGIGTASPGQRLTVAGTVESTSGGFRFPDGTVQTTAATGASGIFVYNHIAVHSSDQGDNSTSFVALNDSAVTLNLPPGMAVMIWSAKLRFDTNGGGPFVEVRPMIGGLVPAVATRDNTVGSMFLSGSFASYIPGGSTSVRLEARHDGGAGSWYALADNSLSWTITVYPQ